MDGIKCVLLDIEGTVCPISFVKDTLFPYALKALPDVLNNKWDSNDFKPYRDAFPDVAKESPEAFQAHVEDLTKRDVKIAYLKNLQGYLWQSGYETGEYSTPLFPDVAPQLKTWKSDGIQLAVYSSGSVFAQKLLFGHVGTTEDQTVAQKRKRSEELDSENTNGNEQPRQKKRNTATKATAESPEASVMPTGEGESSEGNLTREKVASDGEQASNEQRTTATEDLQHLISGWFDTTNAGSKQESKSHEDVATALQLSPIEVLFLSDNVKEVDAAASAGMRSIMVDRPGNSPLSAADRARLQVVNSLDEVNLKVNASQGTVSDRSDTTQA